MAQVVLTPDAETDLLDLLSYLAEKSDRTVDYLTNVVNLVFQNLAEYPLLGRARDELVPGMRSLYSSGYIFFYFSPESNEGDVVLIAHIVRPERDVDALFGAEE